MRVKTPQKKQQKTWIVSKPMDDVPQMRFGANGQRTVTIGRVWAARYYGIMVSRYTDRSGQLDCLTMEERCLTKTGHKM